MDDAELRAFLDSRHTGILVTRQLSAPGVPVPIWFWHGNDNHIYCSSPIRAAKVRRVREFPQVSFLVEAGEAWVDLKAAVIDGTATIHEDGPVHERAIAALDAKYEAFRVSEDQLPGRTQDTYAQRVIIAIHIDRLRASWDNSKIRLRSTP